VWFGRPMSALEIADQLGGDPELFYSEWIRRTFYEVVLPMAEEEGPGAVDLKSVSARMEAAGIRGSHGSALGSLALLLESEAVQAGHEPELLRSSVLRRCKRLRDLHARRRVQALGLRSYHAAADPSVEIQDLVTAVVDAAGDVAARDHDVVIRGADYVDLSYPTPPDEGGLSIGLEGFDDFWRLHPGRLYSVLAKSGSGKSALVGQIADHVAYRCGKRVLWCSSEMSARDCAQRSLARLSRAPLDDIVEGAESERDRALIDNARRWMYEGDFRFVEVMGWSFREVEVMIRAVARGAPLDLVVVDHMHDLRQTRGEYREGVSEDVKAAKALAVFLDCPVIAVWQPTKEGEKADELRFIDAAESAQIKRTSDLAVVLQRPYRVEETDEPGSRRRWDRNRDPERVVLLKDKDRHGPAPRRRFLSFFPERCFFMDPRQLEAEQR